MLQSGLFNKRMNGEEFFKIWSTPETLLQQARFNFLHSWITNPSTASVFPLKLPSDSLLEFLYKYQNDNYKDLTSKIQFSTLVTCRKKQSDLSVEHLKQWITAEDLKSMFDGAMTDLMEDSVINKNEKYLIPNSIRNSLDELHGLIEEREVFKVLNGHAGCGKSTAVVQICNQRATDNKLIISLSNTICNMFKQKVPSIETMSCCKAQFGIENSIASIVDKIENADIIVLDEFSQWGFDWLNLFNRILKLNRNAEVYVMGDIDQIPTFINSGSLLYSIIQEFPDKVTHYTKQWRFINNPKYLDLVDSILKNQIPQNTVISSLNTAIIMNTDCFITGSNKHVDELNSLCLQTRYGCTLSLDNLFGIVCATSGEVPLIASNTTMIQNVKVFNNTRYKVQTIGTGFVILKSLVDNTLVKCSPMDLKCNFKLAYAITVNKAQGLEWENVCCYLTSSDLNLKSFNALYVALTRGKQNIIIASDNNGKGISVKDLQNILNIKYKFHNNFIEGKTNER